MSLIAYPTAGANSYSNLADAEIYFSDTLNASAWDSTDQPTKEKALITVTRLIDRQSWKGAPTVSPQDLDFPRTGLTDTEGVAIPGNDLPPFLLPAVYEYALLVLQSSNLQKEVSSGGTSIRRIRADVTEVEFFNTAGVSTTRLPGIVHELLGRYLASTNVLVIASGTDEVTGLKDYNLSEGFA